LRYVKIFLHSLDLPLYIYISMP